MLHILNRYKWNIAGWTVVVLAVAFVFVQTDYNPPRYLLWVFTERLTGESYHKLPCRKWPTVGEAERIMEERSDVVQRLENLDGHGPDVFLRTEGRCPGKAELDITFTSIFKKKKAQEIIGDDKMFFGIPYNLSNI